MNSLPRARRFALLGITLIVAACSGGGGTAASPAAGGPTAASPAAGGEPGASAAANGGGGAASAAAGGGTNGFEGSLASSGKYAANWTVSPDSNAEPFNALDNPTLTSDKGTFGNIKVQPDGSVAFGSAAT